MDDLLPFKREQLQEQIQILRNDPTVRVKEIRFPEEQHDLHGAHFGSGINFANIIISTNGTPDEENIPVFIKRNPKNEGSLEVLSKFSIFKKEGEWYRTVSMKMLDFCERKAPDVGEKFKSRIPVCYYTDSNSVIVMEDLTKEGYQMHPFDIHQLQDLDHVKLVMEFLATLHGIGYVMKKQNMIQDDITATLNEILYTPENPVIDGYNKSFVTSVLEVFNKVEEDMKYRNILENLYNHGAKCIYENAKPCEPFTVINHGDSWNNNILFKYGEDGKPTSLKFVDWQNLRFSSMTVDLNYFIFSSTTSKFRKDHLIDVLKLYYGILGETIQKLQGSSETFSDFTFNDLYEDFQSRNILGYILFTMLLGVFFTPKESLMSTDDGTDSILDTLVQMGGNILKREENVVPVKKILVEILDEIGDNMINSIRKLQ